MGELTDTAPHKAARASPGKPRPHAVIAGTGRAGTSFLVRFLAACGLGTGDGAYLEGPRAGYEHRLDPDDAALPYVVKDPFLARYCDSLDLTRLTIDALIVPMRDLTAAAESRVLQERRAIAEWNPRDAASDVTGLTPGGIVFSMNVVDQERVLAVGFHKLLHWAMTNGLPLYLLDFPRIVDDADYLIESLSPWLVRYCDPARARAAFAETANPSDVRIRPGRGIGLPSTATRDLDREALLTRIEDLTTALTDARQQLERELRHTTVRHAALDAEHKRLAGEHERLAGAQDDIAAGWKTHFDTARAEVEAARAEIDVLRAQLARIEGSVTGRGVQRALGLLTTLLGGPRSRVVRLAQHILRLGRRHS